MSTALQNLWPDEFGVTETKSPAAILREQATFLGQMTKNLVIGQVGSESLNGRFYHNLYLVAPALGNYRYALVAVSHDIELYPALVAFEFASGDREREANSEEDLQSVLKAVFATDKTKRVVNSLLTQSNEIVPTGVSRGAAGPTASEAVGVGTVGMGKRGKVGIQRKTGAR
jgi:hypothetical protein